ncbi:hypothetical protein CK203_001764 [Vitis vinifera]|uniref:BHLH domain-containing protein n=1 Tax=Vitis vinifera TaxID=29760 RepID=A0A438KJ71_VITVI|nr:hypothetical protein CK203_001764 [Vitis vinifera]
MADQYTKPCSSSPVPPSSASEPDEISLFLHQILFRSSSSSSTTSLHNAKLMPSEFLSENPLRHAGTASSSAGGFDNDLDEYDCESEEGLEALVEEVATKGSSSAKFVEEKQGCRDKASMLDEAIEYLKQLQLQVQGLASIGI